MPPSEVDVRQQASANNATGGPAEASADEQDASAGVAEAVDLLRALGWLDQLLGRAVATAQVIYGQQAAADPYRGLYIGQDEIGRLLATEPGAATLLAGGTQSEEALTSGLDSARLAWLAEVFSLSGFDLAIVLIALAPELDLRYERLYAYLQDNVTRRRPTVELALNLLCASAPAKLARRAHFAADAPLIRHELLQLIADPNQVRPPLLAHYFKLDEQVTGLLLGEAGIDARLAPFCRLILPALTLDRAPLVDELKRALPELIINTRQSRQPLRLYFQGPRGAGKRRAAEALASSAGARLLLADVAGAVSAEPGFDQLMRLLLREAWFQDAILYLDGLDALGTDERAERLLEAVAEDNGVVILAGTGGWAPAGRARLGAITVLFPTPDFALRSEHWAEHLASEGVTLADEEMGSLAGRFRLTETRIADAVATASNFARLRACYYYLETGQNDGHLTIDDLFAAARLQTGHELAALARKIEPVSSWSDIVLPADSLAQLRELCQRVANGHLVLGQWGFGRKLSSGKGVNALFAGPSGTGKTLAAEIIAGALGLDLYRIDLSGVISKYIGETEKNLDRIFKAAEDANAILFFDEADALFGKRSEVRDSHDRYANVEISYLLQKMEEYEGVAVLATNLRQNMDESFVRRLAFTIHFPFPDEESRRRIWAAIFPAQTPLADDFDPTLLARRFKLSGGNIKNIALAAAFLAAADGGPISGPHLLQATRREYQKMGKTLSETELNGMG